MCIRDRDGSITFTVGSGNPLTINVNDMGNNPATLNGLASYINSLGDSLTATAQTLDGYGELQVVGPPMDAAFDNLLTIDSSQLYDIADPATVSTGTLGAYASANDVLSTGSLAFNVAGSSTGTVNVYSGETVQNLVSAINEDDVGVAASYDSVNKTIDLISNTPGAAGAFTVTPSEGLQDTGSTGSGIDTFNIGTQTTAAAQNEPWGMGSDDVVLQMSCGGTATDTLTGAVTVQEMCIRDRVFNSLTNVYTGDSSTGGASVDALNLSSLSSSNVGDTDGAVAYSGATGSEGAAFINLSTSGRNAQVGDTLGSATTSIDVNYLSGGVTKTQKITVGSGTSYNDTAQGLMDAINGSGLGLTATFTTAGAAGSAAVGQAEGTNSVSEAAANLETGIEITGSVVAAGVDPDTVPTSGILEAGGLASGAALLDGATVTIQVGNAAAQTITLASGTNDTLSTLASYINNGTGSTLSLIHI